MIHMVWKLYSIPCDNRKTRPKQEEGVHEEPGRRIVRKVKLQGSSKHLR